jgi:hypothetical protein
MFNQALKFTQNKDFDKALKIYFIIEENCYDEEVKALIYSNMGEIFEEKADLDKAME